MTDIRANLLGGVIIKAGLATKAQLDECVAIQQKELASGKETKLGEVLIAKGYVTKEQLNKILRGDFAAAGKRFGEMCVHMQFVDVDAVTEALKEQTALRKKGDATRIGAILVKQGALKSHQVGAVLKAQGYDVAECSNCKLSYNIALDANPASLKCAKCDHELLLVTGYEDIDIEEVVAGDIEEIPIEDTMVFKAVGAPQEKQPEEISPEEAMAAMGISEVTAQQFGDFQIFEKLGDDHSGTLYRAIHAETRVDVTLKLVRSSLMRDAKFSGEFVEKTTKASALRHKNLKRLLAVGKEQGIFYYAAEYLDGKSLRSSIKDFGKLELLSALKISRDLALALKYAHSKNIFHGDIKPSLIQITSKGEVKLSEIGVAKDARANVERLALSVGVTPCYMAPELAVPGRSPDAIADVYGLGATMYHMITGQPPFKGKTPLEVFMHMAQEEPPEAHKISQKVPPSIGVLLAQMLNPEPPERIADMNAVIKRIDAELKALTPAPGPSTAPEPSTAPGPAPEPSPLSEAKSGGQSRVASLPSTGSDHPSTSKPRLPRKKREKREKAIRQPSRQPKTGTKKPRGVIGLLFFVGVLAALLGVIAWLVINNS